MSVIAWDGRRLSADNQLSSESGVMCQGIKIRRGRGGVLLGWVGHQSVGLGMARWYDNGAKTSNFPDCSCSAVNDSTALIVVLPDASVWCYEHTPEPIRVAEKVCAWGSGGDIALGALLAGAKSRRAAEIACQVVNDCGFGVRSLLLGRK